MPEIKTLAQSEGVTVGAPTSFEGTATAKSADYTVTDTDNIRTILMTTGASTRTVTLPTAADNNGRILTVVKVDSGAGNLVVDGEGAETVNGAASFSLKLQYSAVTLQCNGTAWFAITHDAFATHSAYGTSQESFASTNTLVRSGTYTPTGVSVANLDATPTPGANTMFWSQVGKVVTCSGYVAVNATADNTATSFTLTLPVLPTANFGSGNEAFGVCMFLEGGTGSVSSGGSVESNSGAKTVTVGFFATDVNAGRSLFYQFQYVLN